MFSDVLKSSAGHSSYFYRRVTASCLFTNASLRCFFKNISRVIAVSLHASYYFKGIKKNLPRLKCSPLKTFFNANTDVEPPFTPLGVHNPPSSLRSTSTLPPGDHLTHPGGQLPPEPSGNIPPSSLRSTSTLPP